MFLTDAAFRRYLLGNVHHNPDAVDFWEHAFHPRQAEAALTRLATFLADRRVRDIVGQQTTLDFADMINCGYTVFVNLPANMAPDVKMFIGTMLVSELLQAVRRRIPGSKNTNGKSVFGVYIDEFQQFVTDDFATLFTEGRKFGIATTIAHQERAGQLEQNPKVLGATSAAANKVFFQLTVADAKELAPEFAPLASDEEPPRRSVISPHPVEDIWERGHQNAEITKIREDYFWIVEALKTRPTSGYYDFDWSRAKSHTGNTGNVRYLDFRDDYECYKATPEMIRGGIEILYRRYYKAMRETPVIKSAYKHPMLSDEEIVDLFKLLSLLGGIYGLCPTMTPYIREEVWLRYWHALLQARKQFREEQHRNNRFGYNEEAKLEPLGEFKDFPKAIMPRHIPGFRDLFATVGLSATDIDNCIEWRPRVPTKYESDAWIDLIMLLGNADADMENFKQKISAVRYHYMQAVTAQMLGSVRTLEQVKEGISEQDQLYIKRVEDRLLWQMAEIVYFINYVFRTCPVMLEVYPITIASNDYEETRRRDKTQAEYTNEMEIELSRLPRFTAYTKLIQVRGDMQKVYRSKIETAPPPPVERDLRNARALADFCSRDAGYIRKRVEISQEIALRREEWRNKGTKMPEADRPPPSWA